MELLAEVFFLSICGLLVLAALVGAVLGFMSFLNLIFQTNSNNDKE